ncbi:MAG: hypothetical protein ACLPWS_13960 [Rhodomicrobium sp.]
MEIKTRLVGIVIILCGAVFVLMGCLVLAAGIWAFAVGKPYAFSGGGVVLTIGLAAIGYGRRCVKGFAKSAAGKHERLEEPELPGK